MSTKAKYFRLKNEPQKNDQKEQTDIIMKISPKYGKYISRALTLFFGEDKTFVTIKAAEKLIDRALWVAQVIKRKVPSLHQIINLNEHKTVDVFLPKEQGLLKVQKQRYITIIEITLTKKPTQAEKKAPGYQLPLKQEGIDFLTKQSWIAGEKRRAQQAKERQERGNQRQETYERRGNVRGNRRDDGRGEERVRGRK